MMKLLVCLLAVSSIVLATTTEEYCALCEKHTMCEYPTVAEKCGDGESGVSSEDADKIIDAHNKLRDLVASGAEGRGASGGQPSAKNMERVTWDDGLAEVAQRWADQCSFGHDACRYDPRFPDVWNQIGQNAALDGDCSTQPNWDNSVNMWYNEVDLFDGDTVPEFQYRDDIGHYSQVVWAKTNKVGCGYRTYKEGGDCKRLYICNYGPTGNFPDWPMYEIGDPRTGCPQSEPADSRYPNLC